MSAKSSIGYISVPFNFIPEEDGSKLECGVLNAKASMKLSSLFKKLRSSYCGFSSDKAVGFYDQNCNMIAILLDGKVTYKKGGYNFNSSSNVCDMSLKGVSNLQVLKVALGDYTPDCYIKNEGDIISARLSKLANSMRGRRI